MDSRGWQKLYSQYRVRLYLLPLQLAAKANLALAPQTGFVAGAAAAVAVASGLVLRIRLRFHNHGPEQAAVLLVFHQAAGD